MRTGSWEVKPDANIRIKVGTFECSLDVYRFPLLDMEYQSAPPHSTEGPNLGLITPPAQGKGTAMPPMRKWRGIGQSSQFCRLLWMTQNYTPEVTSAMNSVATTFSHKVSSTRAH